MPFLLRLQEIFVILQNKTKHEERRPQFHHLLRGHHGRIVKRFAELANMPLENALTFFYESKNYELISQGISDMHCLSDYYLADELMIEYKKK